jgi:hypothetical protein
MTESSHPQDLFSFLFDDNRSQPECDDDSDWFTHNPVSHYSIPYFSVDPSSGLQPTRVSERSTTFQAPLMSDASGLLYFPDETQFTPAPAKSQKQNKIAKGDGEQSKANRPDPYDEYPFETKSRSYYRILTLGYRKVGLAQIVQIRTFIENAFKRTGLQFRSRNRAARRRKPNAFHWIDANSPMVGMALLDAAVIKVMGKQPQPRGSAKPRS